MIKIPMIAGIVILVIVFIILAFILVLYIRTRKFKPTSDKQKQLSQLNNDLEPVGFAYDLKGDYFYSLRDCWQREAGYCRLYDEGAPLFNMIMDCEPVTFSYGGKRWLIELWKGQYGITTGGEIGIYNTIREDINTDKFQGTFYESIQDNEQLPMSFVLRRNGKAIMRRKAVHWWLTGFKLGQFSRTSQLTMDAMIKFPDRGMRDAFVEGLMEIGYGKKEFSVSRRTVKIHYTKPHSDQPLTDNKAQRLLVQATNENNCRLYEVATSKYKDTLDKLEYIKAAVPELYEFFLHSLYAKGLFDAFEWIWKIIRPGRPHPWPEPEPCPPCPPRPCPPCPPKPEPPCPPRPCPPCPPKPERPCPPRPCPPCPPKPEPPCPPRPPRPCPPCPPRPEPPCPPCPPRPCSPCSPCAPERAPLCQPGQPPSHTISGNERCPEESRRRKDGFMETPDVYLERTKEETENIELNWEEEANRFDRSYEEKWR